MVKQIVTDPIFLKQRSSAATADDIDCAKDLLDTLKANSERCVGMAANMIGIRKTILATHIGKEYIVMINPVITSRSSEIYQAEEGCLSLVGTRSTTRHKVITVEYLDMDLKKKKKTLRNFDAQIIQHEIDHFSGIII